MVQAIENARTKSSLLKQIQYKLRDNNTDTTIKWILSHIGIKGNDEANFNAKEATLQQHYINYKILIEDMTNHIKEYVTGLWRDEWNKEISNENKLGNIKFTINK